MTPRIRIRPSQIIDRLAQARLLPRKIEGAAMQAPDAARF
jgi:hypothetical protein